MELCPLSVIPDPIGHVSKFSSEKCRTRDVFLQGQQQEENQPEPAFREATVVADPQRRTAMCPRILSLACDADRCWFQFRFTSFWAAPGLHWDAGFGQLRLVASSLR